MGIYLNPNNENFTEILSHKIYVDKTMMLSVLNDFIKNGNKYLCISRPRRFGKTFANNMIAAYYSKGCDSRKLFAPLKIASNKDFEKNLNKFNVIKIDVNSEYRNATDKEKLILKITRNVRDEMQQQFPSLSFYEDDSIADCILKVYSATSEKFMILLDEYDVLIRENVSESLFTQYLDLLNGLFKSDTVRPALALAYLTGILPIVRDKGQSKLNNFREYTILDSMNLTEFVGFTDGEVNGLCAKYNIDFNECKKWYDGYHQHGLDIYNPESVVMSIETGKFKAFWGQTSSYEVISDRIQSNFLGVKDDVIKMISGEKIDVDVGMYKNTLVDFVSKNDVYTCTHNRAEAKRLGRFCAEPDSQEKLF